MQRFDLGKAGEGLLPVKDRAYPEGARVPVGIRREAVPGKLPLLTDRPQLRLPAATVVPGRPEVRPGPLGEVPPPQDLLATPTAADPAALLLAQLATAEVDEIIVSSGKLAARLRPFLPDGVSLSGDDGAGAAIEAAEDDGLLREVALGGGGRLIIDETEALTAIDVDLGHGGGQSKKGAGDSLRARLLDELAAVLSLRGLGGQVILDLPRFAVRQPKMLRDQMTAALRIANLSSVPAVTKEGLVALILQQTGPSLLDRLTAEERGADIIRAGRIFRPDVRALRAWTEAGRVLRDDRSGRFVLRLHNAAATAWKDQGASAALAGIFGARLQMMESAEPGHRITREV
jgi:hypothetical protein